MDNCVPYGLERRAEDLHIKFREACKHARDATMAKLRWGSKLMDFISNNAAIWELEIVLEELKPWITQEKTLEEAQKTGKWIDL